MQRRWRRTCSDIFEFSRFRLQRAGAVVIQFLRSSNTHLSKSQIRQTGCSSTDSLQKPPERAVPPDSVGLT